jgi:hypothetical protein
MKTENINISLANIQDSLKEMDSARVQVEKVTNSSNNLTIATNKLAKEMKSFADNVQSELLATMTSFSNNLNQSKEGINTNIESSNVLIAENLKSSNDQIVNKIERSNNFIEEKIKNSDKDIQVKLDRFKEDVNKLRDVSKVAIGELTSVSKKSLENQNQAILSTIGSINKYITTVQALIDILMEADIQSRLEELKKLNKNLFDKSDENRIELNQVIDNTTSFLNTKLDKNTDELKQFIKDENDKIKRVFNSDISNLTNVVKNETKTIKISIWVLGAILIILASVLIYKLN